MCSPTKTRGSGLWRSRSEEQWELSAERSVRDVGAFWSQFRNHVGYRIKRHRTVDCIRSVKEIFIFPKISSLQDLR